jgi:hypothetical protein
MWFQLQDPGDPVPFAVMFYGEDNLPRRYVPGVGLVHWPSLVSYLSGEEIGAEPITTEEALRLIKADVGKFPDGFDYSSEVGHSPPITVPGMT